MEVLVVGGGPAGATAAHRLAQHGHEVRLVEASPDRAKPCGGGIPMAYVEAYDLPEDAIECRVKTLHFHAPSGRVATCELGDGAYLAMVDRLAFDRALRARAVEAGAELLIGRVAVLRVDESGVAATVRSGGGREESVRADVVIGADGVNSVVGPLTGAPAPPYLVTGQYRIERPPSSPVDADGHVHIYYMPELSSSAYGWLFPRRDHLDLGVAARPDEASRIWRGLDAARAWLPADMQDAEITGRTAWRIPMLPRKRLTADRVILVGDAAGLVAPLTGEGIAYAMQSGALAARILSAEPGDLSASRLASYEHEWNEAHRRSWGVMRTLERQFRGAPWRREALVDFFSDPYVRRFVVSAYATRKLPHRPNRFFAKAVAVALGCLAKRCLVRHPRCDEDDNGSP
jgi:geranylgeranyl reductase